MATENIRIDYVVSGKKQLDESNKSLEKTAKLNDLTQKEITETNSKFKDQEKAVSSTNSAFAGLGGQLTAAANKFQIAGRGAGDLASSMFKATKATQGASKSMRILKVAIASTGIGALIIALGSLTAAFKSSETGQNKFAKLMDTIGVVVGNVSDIFANIGEKIITAFENPQKTIKAFSELVKTNISNRFEGLIEFIPQISKALSQLFSGDFADAAVTAGDAVAKVTLGVEDFSDKAVEGLGAAKEAVKEFGDQTANEVAQAQMLADKRAATDKLERQFLVDTARLESKVADLRLKGRQEDQFTAEERLNFLNEANDLQNQLIETELTIARNRAEEATISNTFSKSTKENLDEEAQLKAKVYQVEAKRLNQQRTLQREINTTSKQAEAALAKEAAAGEAVTQKALEEAEMLRVSQEELNIFKLEQENMMVEAELARRALLLEDETLNVAQRELVIAESEARITDIKQKATDQELAAKKKGQQAITGLIQQGLGDTKAGAVFAAGIQTKEAAIAAYKSVVGIPVVGPFLAPVAAAAATAFGLRNIAQINSSSPKFEKGGRIGGNLHSNGGTHIEAERDEFVMSRKATAKYGFDFMDKVNNLELKPEILDGKATGTMVTVVDTKPIANQLKQMPTNTVNINERGFHVYQRRQNSMMSQKASRYSV